VSALLYTTVRLGKSLPGLALLFCYDRSYWPTAAEQLSDFVAKLRERGIEFVVAKAHLPLRETASAFGGIPDGSWRFRQLSDAVAA
jgi:hypothetical protein